MTRVKKGGITGNYCTFDPIKCQLGHFEFALAVKALVGNLLEAIDFIIGCHRDSQSEKRANYQKYSQIGGGKVSEPKFQTRGGFFEDNFFWRSFGKYPIDPKIRGKFTPSGLNPKSASAIERSPNNTPTNTRV